MSVWPRLPHAQSLQPLNLVIIRKMFSCYIRYDIKYISAINPYLWYRRYLSSFQEIQI